MPQNSSSFTPFDRTVFVQAMFMSFNLVFSTIFNSLLRHRSFFSTACAIQTEQTNVQHFYCLYAVVYGCVVWRPHQPDYRIIKYDCVFDSLLSAQWQNFDFSIRLAFFHRPILVLWRVCVSVRLLVLFQFSTCLCDAGFSSRNIFVDEQTNTNAICWIERIYSHHLLYIYVIFLLLFRVRRTFRPAWILECMSADWFSTIQWYVAPNFTQALLQYMVPSYKIRTHWPSHQPLGRVFSPFV